MKPPVCRLCGEAHWGNDHKIGVNAGVNKAEDSGVNETGVNRKKDRHSAGYMKNYMKRRRGSGA